MDCAWLKFISWDSKKKLLKLLQPEQSDFDWSIVNAMLEGLSDMLPDTNKAHGGDWLKDWLKDFMWEYDLDPADLLMEEKDESNEKYQSARFLTESISQRFTTLNSQ